jgi:subtilisin family serine protease
MIWRVTKNRRVHLAVAKSALTVKADAARRLFDISCQNITWAILDSGIDTKHPAFALTTAEHEAELERKKKALAAEQARANPDATIDEDEARKALQVAVSDLDSRVVKTLDFTRLRELLDYDLKIDAESQQAKDRIERMRTEVARRMVAPGTKRSPSDEEMKAADKLVRDLQSRISDGKEINWQDLEPAIVVEDPEVPTNDHGTHVAGILGADWIQDDETERDLPLALRTRRMQGVCPDIKLIDVRVFREDGLTDEFELLAAIQFLRWMNTRAGTMQVHGANISLSLIHEVRRFACGQTPICDECNEASALGMVIVAAAGNRGFEIEDPDTIRASDSYKSVSITDPGNAANVITHRKRPHEYGVSYFSSRGPTGDGRLKPDLVAPGEKIKGPTPNERAEFKDGTSMAAPHVSGVAAMLMARYSELIGQPERIKSILCQTATDLGRERYFQGHGLVDALRALQSV